MKILRTDGGGENLTDERLIIIRKMLYFFDIKNVTKLHDHKGLLTVFWNEKPNKWSVNKITEIWACFCEDYIEHKLLNLIDITDECNDL